MIIRGNRPADAYTLIPRSHIEDGALSFKARGLLCYILALPQGGDVSVERLVKSGTDGRRAVESGLKELEDAGYLHRDEEWNLATGDGHEPGVETPTPPPPSDPLARPADAPNHWMPTVQAQRSAEEACELIDWRLYVMRYLVRCKERKTQPDSGEWLRWLLEEEQKLRVAEKREAKENGSKHTWWETA
ncbi:helix-turn-helix DNA binding domain protein [Arthrobacter phage BruhMoment]|nr:helix-turn-helix DNA binding domain protein [Arthrobacter phage BruhMoment]